MPKRNRLPKPGRQFENSVFEFAKALDPAAKTFFDHKVRDRDSGLFRQADVWIEARLGGHIPFHVLVSCKDYGRRVTQQQMGAFCDEIRSMGANVGVMYARNGFTEGALKKAKANSISCCQLYENQPADLPKLGLHILHSYPTLHFGIESLNGDSISKQAAKRLLVKEVAVDDFKFYLIDGIASLYQKLEGDSINLSRETNFPSNLQSSFQVAILGEANLYRITVGVRWKNYLAIKDAVVLNGSYCIDGKGFKGTFGIPELDLSKQGPGKGWNPVDDGGPPLSYLTVMCIARTGNIKAVIQDYIDGTDKTQNETQNGNPKRGHYSISTRNPKRGHYSISTRTLSETQNGVTTQKPKTETQNGVTTQYQREP